MEFTVRSDDPKEILKWSAVLFSSEEIIDSMHSAIPLAFSRKRFDVLITDDGLRFQCQGALFESDNIMEGVRTSASFMASHVELSSHVDMEYLIADACLRMRILMACHALREFKSEDAFTKLCGFAYRVGANDDGSDGHVFRASEGEFIRLKQFEDAEIYFTLSDDFERLDYLVVYPGGRKTGSIDLNAILDEESDEMPDVRIRRRLLIAVRRSLKTL